MSAGRRATFARPAAAPIAPPTQADEPAANSCSGLVPGPFEPGGDRVRLILPSGLVALPSRPAVALAVSEARMLMALSVRGFCSDGHHDLANLLIGLQ